LVRFDQVDKVSSGRDQHPGGVPEGSQGWSEAKPLEPV